MKGMRRRSLDPRIEHSLFRWVVPFLRMESVEVGASLLDPFLTNVESATPLASVDGQLIAFAGVAGCPVPELEAQCGAQPRRGGCRRKLCHIRNRRAGESIEVLPF